MPRGPGKTAPRLINDLLDYDPRKREQRRRNLFADPAPQFDGSHIHRRGDNDCRHQLKKNVDRCNVPVSSDVLQGSSTKYMVSTFCSDCHYYFDVTVDYTEWRDGQSPCRLTDTSRPLHHLQLVETIYAKDQPSRLPHTKYKPSLEFHRFKCSQQACPAFVEVEISSPRLPIDLLSPLLDGPTVRARGIKEIQDDPVRFDGQAPVTPLLALGFLRTYLTDAKAASFQTGSKPKRIAKRNKKFALAFAEECDALFHFLDFTTTEEVSAAEGEEMNYYWQPPTVTDQTVSFFDDIIAELSKQIELRPLAEKQASRQWITYSPVPAKRDIENLLGYYDYTTRSRSINLDPEEEHPHYVSLGCVYDFQDDYLSWAYDRQCECDPDNKPYYLDCLHSIAQGRESSDLQTRVVMAMSAGEDGLRDIQNAYNFFNLDPKTTEADDHIIGLFKSRIESAPRQKDEARKLLLVIGKSRKSDAIVAVANDRAMTLQEALDFFSVAENVESDSLEAVAVAMSFDGDASKVARALRVIANARNDHGLQRTAANMETGNSTSTLGVPDAYKRLQISVRNIPDETVFIYYQNLMADAGQGSKDSFTEALRVIAIDRGSNFLLTKLDDPNAVVTAEPSTSSQPVGLDNIGNTCYLNSLLQYYYTVKPVRNVVMDFQNHRMALNDEAIKKKRVGGRIVAKSEIIKAQKFVDELHELFENLKTASTHSVKPTRELAELTIFSSAAEANFRRASISSPSGPPNLSSILDSPVNGAVYGPQLPPPPTSPPPVPIEDDIEMVDHPSEKMEDDSSEATLVDLAEPLPSYEDSMVQVAKEDEKLIKHDSKAEKKDLDSTALDGALDEDAVMVNGEDAAEEKRSMPPPPEKQPPLPPRNKAGLVIQTNDRQSSISDDELWKFGSQQDVTEVIGNVNFRLLCALKPTSIDEQSGEQMDIVRDTLYGSNAVYLQKASTTEKKVEAWSNLIVFPAANGPRDIYEALDVVFDEQIVDIDNTTAAQHASISQLPPIIHIQIQRTAFDSVRQVASKNRNAVNFPETIYLDRYMDSADPESILMRRRRETWKWKSQLKVLEAREAALNTTMADVSVKDALIATRDYVDKLHQEEIDGVLVDPNLSESLEDRTMEVAEEIESISNEIAGLKQNLNEQFTDMRQCEYKLQAVFIHRGEAGGGHYWVYIYDFESDIWREYNDEYVTEVKDRRRVFEHQGAMGGTPYYLAYVRSSDMKELVQAVCREVPEDPVSDPMESPQVQNSTPLVSVGDEQEDSRYVEHARPRPIRPKPSPIASWDDQIAESEYDANGKPW